MGKLLLAKVLKAPSAATAPDRYDAANKSFSFDNAFFDFSRAPRSENAEQGARPWHHQEFNWNNDGHPDAPQPCRDSEENPPPASQTDDEEDDCTPHSPPPQDNQACFADFRDAIGDLFRSYCAGDQADFRDSLHGIISDLRDCLTDWRDGWHGNDHTQTG
jgi:hypothetical protein